MPTLTLKNIPADLHARLKASAEQNRLSLNSEILVRFDQDEASSAGPGDAPRQTESVHGPAGSCRSPEGDALQTQGSRLIVVDSNVIVYSWISGARTDIAQRVRAADPDWQVPLLWRSEVRSTLAGFMRDGSIGHALACVLMRHIEEQLSGGASTCRTAMPCCAWSNDFGCRLTTRSSWRSLTDWVFRS